MRCVSHMDCVACIVPSILPCNPLHRLSVLHAMATSQPDIRSTALEMALLHVSHIPIGLTTDILSRASNLPDHIALYATHGGRLLANQLAKLANEWRKVSLALLNANIQWDTACESNPPQTCRPRQVASHLIDGILGNVDVNEVWRQLILVDCGFMWFCCLGAF
jgi:hypothetical protein